MCIARVFFSMDSVGSHCMGMELWRAFEERYHGMKILFGTAHIYVLVSNRCLLELASTALKGA